MLTLLSSPTDCISLTHFKRKRFLFLDYLWSRFAFFPPRMLCRGGCYYHLRYLPLHHHHLSVSLLTSFSCFFLSRFPTKVFLPWYVLDVIWLSGLWAKRARMVRGLTITLAVAATAKLIFDILLPLRLDGLIDVPYIGCTAPLLLALLLVLVVTVIQVRASVWRVR